MKLLASDQYFTNNDFGDLLKDNLLTQQIPEFYVKIILKISVF